MKIGICDNSEEDRAIIHGYCEKFEENSDYVFEYVMFTSGEEVLEYDREIDLLFLDIELDGIDGISVKEKLARNNKVWRIVFVSSHKECVYDAYGLKTVGFINKPVVEENLYKPLRIVTEEYSNSKVYNFISEGDSKWVRVEDIVYISGEKNYVRLVTTHEEFLIYTNLKKIEEEMKEYSIIRVHRSVLVNMAHIAKISEFIYINDREEKLPLGRKYIKVTKEKYEQYLLDTLRRRVS